MADAKRKGTLTFLLAVAAMLALLPLSWWLFLRTPDPPPPPPPPPKQVVAEAPPDAGVPAPPDLMLAEVSGTVEIRKGKGQFQPAAVGAILAADDALRTTDGRVRLTAKDAYEVEVEQGTSLEVAELNAKLARLRLNTGMVVAKVEGGGERRMEVSAANSDAVAASSDGTFAISNNGAGTVAVGARAGEVEFQAAGQAVLLRAGQQSIATGGKAPSAPSAIPGSLFLKVDWPQDREINRRKVVIAGKAAPGSVLMVGGQPVRVEKDGRFKAGVSLREGKNLVEAMCIDLAGRRSETKTEIKVDTTAPDSDVATQKLWER